MAKKRGTQLEAGRVTAGPENWPTVADALNARMAEQRIGQQALSTASGVSVATLRHLQRGTSGRRAQDSTLAAVSRALDWPDGYLLSVLVGGTYVEPAGSETPAVYDALRAVEAQLARMNDRLEAVERAVGALAR